MTKQQKIANFNPSGVGINNGHFIGLPFEEDDAEVVVLPVPWDVTVSYGGGTSTGPQNILDCSPQLDLYDEYVPNGWKYGIYMQPTNKKWLNKNNKLRKKAKKYIDFLENGGNLKEDKKQQKTLNKINKKSGQLNKWIFNKTSKIINTKKKVGLVGGEHSVPLGYLKALSKKYNSFGILQIDAHQDLRKSYEGFEHSHASIFYNALKIKNIKKLVQVGIRDHCEEEIIFTKKNKNRIDLWTDEKIKSALFNGKTFSSICKKIIAPLPQQVYISFDIDGLQPSLCPNTGTPVPGGLSYEQAIFLLQQIVESGREIIGFDLCEVAGTGNEWDGNIGARVLYKLCNLMIKSTPA